MSQDRICGHNEYLNNDDDVIAFSPNSLCKIAKIKEVVDGLIKEYLGEYRDRYFKSKGIQETNTSDDIDWYKTGKDCEILQVGSNGWKKGKIRLKVSLEFIPDEPEINEIESPLDDIRQSMN
ncbi:MAG: KGK domain-containing protein [Crocosphaera sp.]